MTPSRARTLFGTDEPVAATTRLRAGPLTLALRAGRLWDVCAGGVEIWHGVAFLYRDADWGTPEPVVDRCESTLSVRAFRIRCTGHFPTAPRIDFRLEFEGTRAGVVRVTGEAVPRGDIATNRLGLCVMHPMAAGGRRVEVEHVDGRISRSTFPTLIPAWPPFMLVRAIRHEYAPSCWARCTFDGDAFEVEDQRNNSDASFKTYNRSNMMPRPYWLRAGEPIRQSVELALEAPPARSRSRRAAPVAVRIGDATGSLPPIGVEIFPHDAAADEATRRALAALRPAHLHLALESGGETEGKTVDWKGVAGLLETAGARLRLDISAGDIAQVRPALESLRRALGADGLVPESIAVFPSEPRTVETARRTFPDSLIGGGTRHFFVQLNRAEGLGDLDFLTFTTSPIVHGADDESVMLSLRSLPSMIATLNARYPGVPIRVGPSTIAARSSPLGRQPESDGTKRIALSQQDPRCRGLFGAAWLLGYVTQLTAAHVGAITLMSFRGACGLVGPARRGVPARHPACHVLERLRAPAGVAAVSISEPSRLAALALARGDRSELLLANLTGGAIEVELEALTAPFDTAVMDARSLQGRADAKQAWRFERQRAHARRVKLDAYAVACLLRRQ
jgi:hypothetical protein